MKAELQRYYSPDEIAGRMKVDPPLLKTRVSRQTIYNWIHQRPAEENWRQYLRCWKHNKRGTTGKIPRAIEITGRPAEANERQVVGHWEGDTLLAAGRRGGLVTLVDRKSRYVLLKRTKDCKARRVRLKLQEMLNELPAENSAQRHVRSRQRVY